jgi:hypothetical protein
MAAVDPIPSEPPNNDGRYAMDVRLFIALLTVTMTVSFLAGMYGVTESYRGEGAAYRPTQIEEIALRFLFPNLFPVNVDIISKEVVDVPNHSDSAPNTFFIAEDEHRPSGQHLLVDIKGVDAEFLNSEELLSKALVDAVKETGYVKLTFYCLVGSYPVSLISSSSFPV